MGLLDIFSGIGRAVSSCCAKIGGAVMSGISRGMSAAVQVVGSVLSPGLRLVERAIRVVAKIVSAVAEILIEKPKEEEPEELGMKAEVAHEQERITPEDFSSVDEYIQYIRENIELDKERLENINEEERAKYSVIGTGLYVKSMEENYGVILDPEFYRAAYRLNMNAETAARLIKAMGDNGIKHARCFEDYLLDNLVLGSSVNYDMSMVMKEVFETEDAVNSLRQSYAKYVDDQQGETGEAPE